MRVGRRGNKSMGRAAAASPYVEGSKRFQAKNPLQEACPRERCGAGRYERCMSWGRDSDGIPYPIVLEKPHTGRGRDS